MYKTELLFPESLTAVATEENRCRLIYIKRGRLNVFSGKNSYTLRSGEGLLIFPQGDCSFDCDEFVGFGVWFDRTFPTTSVFENKPPCFHIKASPKSTFRILCNELYSMLCKGTSRDLTHHTESIINAAVDIFLHHLRAYSKNYTLRCSRPVSAARAYIDENYTKSITVYDVAESSGLSVSRLYVEFTAEFSVSPKQYILNKRLEKACRLLSTTTLSVTEISIAVGFGTSSGFDRIFRKSFGMTPLEYRNTADV